MAGRKIARANIHEPPEMTSAAIYAARDSTCPESDPQAGVSASYSNGPSMAMVLFHSRRLNDQPDTASSDTHCELSI